MEQEQKLAADQIIKFLEERNFKELKEELENLHPVDLVDAMEELDKKQRMLVFRLLSKEEAAEVFTDMNSDMREELLEALTDSELKEIMDEMYVDDTVDVLEEMPANVVDRLLMATDEETRKQINTLLQYPEDSAGSIMNIEYISLRKEMTVADAILKIRQVGINRETIYTCYVTEKRKLIGVVDVKDLLTAGESRLIERSWMRMLFMQERWMIRNRWPIRSTNTDLLQFRSWIMKTAWWELLQLMMPCLFCRMRQQRTSVLWRVSVRMKILILELQYFSMQRTVLYG